MKRKYLREVFEGDLGFFVMKADRGHLCGYVQFPRPPLKEPSYEGIVIWVPVHGGISYAELEDDGSMVYGFDCMHYDDDRRPETKDPDWALAETRRMATGILAAARIEDAYLAANDLEQRAEVLEQYHAELAERDISFKLSDNFGAMLSTFSGRL